MHKSLVTSTTHFLHGSADSSCIAQDAIEQERLRLAHDLHDDLGSRLIAIKMALAPLLRDTPEQSHASPPHTIATAASRADKLLDEAIDAMHGILHNLRPPELDIGLVAALQQIANAYQIDALPCYFSSNQLEIDVPPELTLGLLRICREALTNVSKHANASRVVLRLMQQQAPGEPEVLLLDVIDDGHGLPPNAPVPASIQRRVQMLGGTLAQYPVENNASGNGCHLHIRIPLPFTSFLGSS